MAGKHTQGQWIAEFETVGNGGWREPDDVATIYCGEKIIATYSVSYCEYPESRDENEANARLIAAAPDLLEALQDAEASLATLFESGDFGMEDRAIEFGMDALADIRAAIARATQPLPPQSEE